MSIYRKLVGSGIAVLAFGCISVAAVPAAQAAPQHLSVTVADQCQKLLNQAAKQQRMAAQKNAAAQRAAAAGNTAQASALRKEAQKHHQNANKLKNAYAQRC